MKSTSPCEAKEEENAALRELALHLLDVIENAVRAQATVVRLSIHLDKDKDLLTLCVEDDGPGLPVDSKRVLDPFYTTKTGKRTGLGLSLFNAAAQRSEGGITLSKAEFGGTKVEALFKYGHWDRAPIGDIAGTLKAVAVANPEIVWICRIEGSGGAKTLILQDVMAENTDISLFRAVDIFADRIRACLQEANISTG